jgi:tRNA pseudouridine32 synthase/23S rRNA pseudouridine746 synthase
MNSNLFTLVDQTDRFLIINKHSGVDFHKGHHEQGLCVLLRDELSCPDLFPLHRLDTMTSGLLLFAKDKKTVQELAREFRDHTIDKYYCALAGTHPKKKQGTVIGDMVRSRNGTWVLTRSMHNPAITQFFSTGLGNGFRLYILKPHTGRTHQIRVAMKSLGVPVFGDPLYYSSVSDTRVADRGYLHAYALRFALDGRLYVYVHKPDSGYWFNDAAIQCALDKYTEPWSLPWPVPRRPR